MQRGCYIVCGDDGGGGGRVGAVRDGTLPFVRRVPSLLRKSRLEQDHLIRGKCARIKWNGQALHRVSWWLWSHGVVCSVLSRNELFSFSYSSLMNACFSLISSRLSCLSDLLQTVGCLLLT